MKIIRVRRGFSTNCSGANEYFPPDGLVLPGPDYNETLANTKVVSRWVSPNPDRVPYPWMNKAPGDALPADAGADQPDAARVDTGSSVTTTNAVILVAVVLGVAALFGAERLIRSLRRKAKAKTSHDDSSDD